MQEEQRLPLYKSIIYSIGNIGVNLIDRVIVAFAIYYYAPVEEKGAITYAPIVFIGFAMTFGRIIDSIADPLVGFFSDRTKTKLGRRIPFVLFGTPLLVLSFILYWFPPIHKCSIINVYYAAIILGIYFLFYTIVVAPYLSLIPEIARTKNDRINLVTFQGYFAIIGILIASLGCGYLIDNFGFKIMGITMGIITFISFYIPLITTRETPYTLEKEVKLSFFQAVFYSLKNKPFLYYILCLLFFWLGVNMILIALPYIAVVLMKTTEGWGGYLFGILTLVATAFFPCVNLLAKKFGKKIVFLLSVLGLTILLPLISTIGSLGFLSPFYQGIIIVTIMGIPAAALFVLPYAILADTIDYDEKQTGYRREAMYYGMQGLITKGAIATSALIGTQFLNYFGYKPDNYLGILLIGPVAAVLVFIGFLIFLKYPFKE